MARGLKTGLFLATALLGISLVLLVSGLAMVARPESFVGLGLRDPARAGLEIALAAGIGAIFSALLSRVLDLLLSTLGDET